MMSLTPNVKKLNQFNILIWAINPRWFFQTFGDFFLQLRQFMKIFLFIFFTFLQDFHIKKKLMYMYNKVVR